MSSIIAPSNPLNSHKKRPHHPSPIHSYRSNTAQDRHGFIKRARWDVTSPTPSPPILSLPLPPTATTTPSSSSSSPEKQRFQFASTPSAFRFGLQPAQTSTTEAESAPSRPMITSSHHQRSKRHKGHSFSSRRTSGCAPRIAGDEDEDDLMADRVRGFERLRRSTVDEGELFVSKMREWEEQQATAVSASVSSASSPPYLSHSITSNSTSMSGSDHSRAGRKRSWSIVQDHEEDPVSGTGEAEMEVEWEVVRTAKANKAAIAVNDANPVDSMSSSVVSGDGGDGDDEDEDEDDQVSDDSDDDLVFVIGNAAQTTGKELPTILPPPGGAEHMLSELQQILAAGGADLEESLHIPNDPDRMTDAGSLWQ